MSLLANRPRQLHYSGYQPTERRPVQPLHGDQGRQAAHLKRERLIDDLFFWYFFGFMDLATAAFRAPVVEQPKLERLGITVT